jgi:hypothetical protein
MAHSFFPTFHFSLFVFHFLAATPFPRAEPALGKTGPDPFSCCGMAILAMSFHSRLSIVNSLRPCPPGPGNRANQEPSFFFLSSSPEEEVPQGRKNSSRGAQIRKIGSDPFSCCGMAILAMSFHSRLSILCGLARQAPENRAPNLSSLFLQAPTGRQNVSSYPSYLAYWAYRLVPLPLKSQISDF